VAERTLIFIPTYNERENAANMCEQVHRLGLDADVLFVDDNSPDGTGALLEGLRERFPRLIVHHRAGKLGIGSAHAEAIGWAYDQGYQVLVTLDCDFTHSPSDIPALLDAARDSDLAVGSRWARADSLPGWNLFRRGMTRLGHWLTKTVLGIPQDASGAFRVYRLDRLPRALFGLVRSRGYSFFFESLFVFNRNGLAIAEVPIVLPARTYGHSKMSAAAAFRSARYVFELYLDQARAPERYLLPPREVQIDASLVDPQDWNGYWERACGTDASLYGVIAGLYRRGGLGRALDRAIGRAFPPGAALLHAGCGSGQVDVHLQHRMRVTALDICPGALRLYARNNPRAAAIRHGSIFALPFPDGSFDGVYNLGVMEHFTRAEIGRILAEFRRVLKPGGKAVLFWPHRRGTSVFVLRIAHFLLGRFARTARRLHPPEITLLRDRDEAAELLEHARLRLLEYRFGPRDLFVQAVVVAGRDPA
jgi:dolichol-phosphate mannosyltransferase